MRPVQSVSESELEYLLLFTALILIGLGLENSRTAWEMAD